MISGSNIPSKYSQQVNCPDCITELDDNFYDLTYEDILDAIPSESRNIYLYSTSDKVKVRDSSIYKLFWELPSMTALALGVLTHKELSLVLHESLAYQIIDDITADYTH